MVTKINDTNYIRIAGSVKPDNRKRVVLPKTLVPDGIIFHIWHNNTGQILLDPQVTIPASELWLFENKKVLAMIDRGASETQLINRGSFAKYVKNASEVKI